MSSIPETGLNETAVAVPIGSPGAIAAPRAGLRVRPWMFTALLFLVPLIAFWPATFHDYGLRDDYSNLREAHEEVGKILQFCASHARPVYGWLLQASYGQTTSVQNLQWSRFGAALLLGALSLVSFRGLRAVGWPIGSSVCFALMLSLVPSAQVIASWAVGWPYAATALLAFGGFFIVEGALAAGLRAGVGRAVIQWGMALWLMIVSALIYQPSALFYLVPLAATLIAQRKRDLQQSARWLGIHVGFVACTLVLAYGTMSLLYAMHVFVKSGRIAFETHWGEKIAWFLQEPLPNALSLFVLNDNNDRNHFLYLACAAIVGAILVAGAVLEWRRHGMQRGVIWLTGLMGLPVMAFAVSMLAAERYATYRTILAMTGVLLCFLVASVSALTQHWSNNARRLTAALAVSVAFFTAQYQAYSLIAVPQGNEWQLIVDGAKQVHLGGARPRIFAIACTPRDISTDRIYHDEFGSLSSNSEWVPREMFKRAMHDLHPGVRNLDSLYDFATGPMLPADQPYDVVIDLHRLRQFYASN